jgi:hypothetical protein
VLAARDEVEAKLQDLELGMPPDAARIIQEADDVIARNSTKVAALKAKRDQLDGEFRIARRQHAVEEASKREQERLEVTRSLVDAEAERLALYDGFEADLRGAIDKLNKCLAAANRVSAAASALCRFGGVERPRLNLSQAEFVSRTAGRVAATMAQIRGHPFRFGTLEWSGGSLYVGKCKWAESEERLWAGDIATAIETAKRSR